MSIEAVTCIQVSIKIHNTRDWVAHFAQLPTIAEIRRAVELKLDSGRSSNAPLLDVIDGIRPDDVQQLVEFTRRNDIGHQNRLVMHSYTPSGRTHLGDVEIMESNATVFLRPGV